MKKVLSPLCSYSLIEIALTGQNLRPQEKASACEFLLSCSVPERNLAITDYHGIFHVSFYTHSWKKVQEIRAKYKASGYRFLALKLKRLRQHDWFDKWKRDYHIGPLGTKFMIVPIWEKNRFKSRLRRQGLQGLRSISGSQNPGLRIPIYLEPGSAFGSGYHETTRLIVRLLESLEGKIGSFLDIGCGTGILSTIASKMGARKIIGYDNDRPSALLAGKNFRENQCEGGTFLCVQLKQSRVCGHFDVVGANLLSKTLLEHRARLVARVRPGGYLLVSGIALQNFPAFKRGFSKAPLKCLKILRGRRWVAVLYKKSK